MNDFNKPKQLKNKTSKETQKKKTKIHKFKLFIRSKKQWCVFLFFFKFFGGKMIIQNVSKTCNIYQ